MKIFIAIPCMEDLPVDFVMSLTKLELVEETTINYSVGSLIYASRDFLAGCAIKAEADYILWLDSDMIFEPTLLKDLLRDIKGKDFVSGLYFRRKPPFTPVLYETIRLGLTADDAITKNYDNFPQNEVFEIDACGFGACLMKTEVAKKVFEQKGQMFSPINGYGEDISFCIRAKQVGYKLWCDPKPYLGHVAKTVVDKNIFMQLRGGKNGID